ncbi:hypothetical protein [Candidatus Poriferisodalis sp.]
MQAQKHSEMVNFILSICNISSAVEAVFEDHDDGSPPFTLVQWQASAS